MITDVSSTLGTRFLSLVKHLGAAGLLFHQVLREVGRKPRYHRLVVEQIYQVGLRSWGIVFVTAISTGMVMALQFGLSLEKFGGQLYVPKIVSLSIVREIGPVFCSLMFAARVGAGIASEIASMVVTDQIDAIRALGTSPIKRIVIPRILGCLVALPLLATLGDFVGVFGAFLVGVLQLDLDPMFFYQKVVTTVIIVDYVTGIFKTIFFSLFISVTACYFGLNVKGGTRGVGVATTMAVVVSSVSILISDFFLTKAFFILIEK
jgi:phospholipid/cholesterol/gamma-HCH transport system permease protein